jgi:hypothetical protein
MALIPPGSLDAVVAVGFPADESNQATWRASGFVYGQFVEPTEEAGRNLYRFYLVTNRHVLEGARTAFLRFNPPEPSEPAREYTLNLENEAGEQWWSPHPDPEIDVAVAPINIEVVRGDGIPATGFRFVAFTAKRTSSAENKRSKAVLARVTGHTSLGSHLASWGSVAM